MTFDQLLQLVTIVRKGSATSASKELHITQPALSRSMQRLEMELEHELFIHTKNRIVPNEAGMIVTDFALSMLREERIMRDALDQLSLRNRTLRIGTVAPAPVWRLTALTVESYPGTVLQPTTLDGSKLPQALTNRSIDMAITLEPINSPTCDSISLMHEELYVCVPHGHPLDGAKGATLAQFDGETFLVDSSAGFWIDLVRRMIPQATLVEQPDRTVLLQLVETIDLLAFATDQSLQFLTGTSRHCVPLTDEGVKMTFYLNALRDAPQRVREIMDCARVQVEKNRTLAS